MKSYEKLQTVLLMIIALLLAKIAFGGPQEELIAAVDDLQQRPVELRAMTRYISLYSIPKNERDQVAAGIGFVVNSISRSSVIVSVDRVNETLVAINLAAIAPNPEERQIWSATWESLVGLDPYWHLSTKVINVATPENPDLKDSIIISDGPWLDQEMTTLLREQTLSAGAILRADWWLSKVMSPPYYYAFAGVPETQAEWFKQFGIDYSLVRKLRGVSGANLFRSGVTHRTRRLFRLPASTGGAVWVTYDNRGGVTVDPIRNPTLDIKFDASEQIAVRPNGLHKFVIFDANGKRVDVVPPDIALDDSTHPTEPLQPMMSCVRCHVTDDGILAFKDVQSELFSRETNLVGTNPSQIEEIASFYIRQERLQRAAERDREDYRESVLLATGGLDLKTTVEILSRTTHRYRYDPIDEVQAAAEIGVAPEVVNEQWKRSGDPVLLALRSGFDTYREQFEASFTEGSMLAYEIIPEQVSETVE